MVDIDIKVDTHGLEQKLEEKASQLDGKISQLQRSILDFAHRTVQKEAPRKTGRLKSSVQTDHKTTVFIDKRMAPYCDWVIDGHKTRPSKKRAKTTYMGKSTGFTRGQRWVKGNPFVDRAVPLVVKDIDIKLNQFIKWLEV